MTNEEMKTGILILSALNFLVWLLIVIGLMSGHIIVRFQ
jgi:hypothetical protein